MNFSVILVESAKGMIDFFNTITLYVGEAASRLTWVLFLI